MYFDVGVEAVVVGRVMYWRLCGYCGAYALPADVAH